MSGSSQSRDVGTPPSRRAVAPYALIFYLSHGDAAIFTIHTSNIAELLRSGHSEPFAIRQATAQNCRWHRDPLGKAASATSSLLDPQGHSCMNGLWPCRADTLTGLRSGLSVLGEAIISKTKWLAMKITKWNTDSVSLPSFLPWRFKLSMVKAIMFWP